MVGHFQCQHYDTSPNDIDEFALENAVSGQDFSTDITVVVFQVKNLHKDRSHRIQTIIIQPEKNNEIEIVTTKHYTGQTLRP